VDRAQPGPSAFVERRRPDLFEQLLDHRADAHDLGRLLHHRGHFFETLAALAALGRGRAGAGGASAGARAGGQFAARFGGIATARPGILSRFVHRGNLRLGVSMYRGYRFIGRWLCLIGHTL
jgi:hypothetical protein